LGRMSASYQREWAKRNQDRMAVYRERRNARRRAEHVCAARRHVDSSQFTGPGAIMGMILAWVRHDYWNAPEGSAAFRTARAFLDGETCTHVECGECKRKCGGEFGRTRCRTCGHHAKSHLVAEYDWGQWRDEVIGSLGMNVEGFVNCVREGRRAIAG
jgi:hypothetical protein